MFYVCKLWNASRSTLKEYLPKIKQDIQPQAVIETSDVVKDKLCNRKLITLLSKSQEISCGLGRTDSIREFVLPREGYRLNIKVKNKSHYQQCKSPIPIHKAYNNGLIVYREYSQISHQSFNFQVRQQDRKKKKPNKQIQKSVQTVS